jgi:hypothetical protein
VIEHRSEEASERVTVGGVVQALKIWLGELLWEEQPGGPTIYRIKVSSMDFIREIPI